MGINIILLGQLILISMFVVGGLSYYLGKRKTSTPKVAAFIGVILSVFPPLNIAYLIVLMLKNDISEKQVNEI